MKFLKLKKLIQQVASVFSAKEQKLITPNAKKTLTSEEALKLAQISLKARTHLAKQKLAGEPAPGKAVFKPGAVVSTKFWGELASKVSSESPSSRKATERVAYRAKNAINFTPEKNDGELRKLAMQRKAERDRLTGFDRQSFAGIPLHKIEAISVKAQEYAKKNFPAQNDDAGINVVELDFENNTADVTHYQEPKVLGLKPSYTQRVAI